MRSKEEIKLMIKLLVADKENFVIDDYALCGDDEYLMDFYDSDLATATFNEFIKWLGI